jgi:hypothetical protein
MTKTAALQNSHKKNARRYFAKPDQNETSAKQIRKKERAADAAKTAKLRGLRLAKEAADKEVADKLAAEKAEAQAGKRPARRTPERKRAPVRMIY